MRPDHRFFSPPHRPASRAGEHRWAEPRSSGSWRSGRRCQGGASGGNQQHDDGADEHRHLCPEEAICAHQKAAAATGYATLHTHRWEEELWHNSNHFVFFHSFLLFKPASVRNDFMVVRKLSLLFIFSGCFSLEQKLNVCFTSSIMSKTQ